MAVSTSRRKIDSQEIDHPSVGVQPWFYRATRSLRAVAKAAIFFLKVFPMLPSRPVDWVTKAPVIKKVKYPTQEGQAEGDLYLPPGDGPFPALLVCLGVVPFEIDHPQVPVLGKALARAGCAALLYWSPSMRDLRLDPVDIQDLALAYDWLVGQPYVDASRSGLFGTCVGGSFALMASASLLIRDRVGFVGAYAPFSSMWTFARDIASGSCTRENGRGPWKVDQLTRKVFLHSVTATLEPSEAERIRNAFELENGNLDQGDLSADGRSICSLLTAHNAFEAEAALHRLPPIMQQGLTSMSPENYLQDIHAPLMVLLHDRGDQVIPVGESRRLVSALTTHAGVHYTEMQFQHLDPVKGKLPLPRLIRELVKFFLAVYPMFRQATA